MRTILSARVCLAWILVIFGPRVAAAANPATDLVAKYCVSCHNERSKTANLVLDALTTADDVRVESSPDTWEKVAAKLRSRAMPPPGRRPDNATYDAQPPGWKQLDRAAMNPNPAAGESPSAESY
jgi:hypothetical protein